MVAGKGRSLHCSCCEEFWEFDISDTKSKLRAFVSMSYLYLLRHKVRIWIFSAAVFSLNADTQNVVTDVVITASDLFLFMCHWFVGMFIGARRSVWTLLLSISNVRGYVRRLFDSCAFRQSLTLPDNFSDSHAETTFPVQRWNKSHNFDNFMMRK
jgi:hypothetical protein